MCIGGSLSCQKLYLRKHSIEKGERTHYLIFGKVYQNA